MKKSLIVVLLITILISSVTFVYAETNVSDFRYKSQVVTDSHDKNGFFILNIDPKVYSTMNTSLRDLRIYNVDGLEVGYTRLDTEDALVEDRCRELKIINKGIIKDSDMYSFTVENVPANIDRMTVKLASSEYLVKAKIYGSNDNRLWQEVGLQTLYGINGNYNNFALNNVDYKYLRFEYPFPKEQYLGVLSVGYTIRIQSNREPKETPFSIFQTNTDKNTTISIDLGNKNRNSKALRLVTSEKNFYRQAYLEASNDKEHWTPISKFYLYKVADGRDENTGIDYPSIQARYLRITIYNEDNIPVTFTKAMVKLEPIRLLVKDSVADGPFSVYWGNDRLDYPTYDVEAVLKKGKVDFNTLPAVTIDSYTKNSKYQEIVPPLTERYPFLLPLVLILAVLVVGIVQFKSFKKVEGKKQ